MNKIVIAIAVLLFVVIGGVSTYIIFSSDPTVDTTSPQSTPSNDHESAGTLKPVVACDILTQDIAEELLGKDIDHSSTPPTDTGTPGVSQSTCNYLTKFNTNAKTKEEAIKSSGLVLVVQSAKTQDGVASLRELYDAFPDKTQKLKGFGDEAFYSSSLRQIHVLKGGNWYAVMYFKDVITNGSLASDKLLAEKLSFR